MGVIPRNILHKTIRRNEHLAKVFYDLVLMEREGLGYDRMYEVLLSSGKQLLELIEGDDRVLVTIRKGILRNEIVKLITRANQEYPARMKLYLFVFENITKIYAFINSIQCFLPSILIPGKRVALAVHRINVPGKTVQSVPSLT